MTSANNLGLGKDRAIKIRNLERLLNNVELVTYTPMMWCGEDRDWYAGEKEEIMEELRKTIAILSR